MCVLALSFFFFLIALASNAYCYAVGGMMHTVFFVALVGVVGMKIVGREVEVGRYYDSMALFFLRWKDRKNKIGF